MSKARIVYDRTYGLPGHIVLRGQSGDQRAANEITFELARLSKFIWGSGFSLNSIFNSGSGMVKFQSDAATNLLRAKTLAWAWRLAKAYDIEFKNIPTYSSQKAAGEAGMFTEDRSIISQRLADLMQNKSTS